MFHIAPLPLTLTKRFAIKIFNGLYVFLRPASTRVVCMCMRYVVCSVSINEKYEVVCVLSRLLLMLSHILFSIFRIYGTYHIMMLDVLHTDGFSSTFHTILQNFRQKKVEIFLLYGKAGFFVSFVKIVLFLGSKAIVLDIDR
jgi:hypothetical protein